MTLPNRHCVQRQLIELRLGEGLQAPEVQDRMARSYWARTVGELEAVFDRVAGPGKRLRLDRLEIELGQISDVDWESALQERLVEEVSRTLAQYVPVAAPGGPDASQGGASAFESFVHFLTHGRLPWWSRRPLGQDSLVPRLSKTDWLVLRGLVINDSRARVRLVDSLTDDLLQHALGRWADLPGAVRVLEALTPKHASTSVVIRWRRHFWLTLFELLSQRQFRVGNGPSLWRDLLNVRRLALDPGEGEARVGPEGPLEVPEPWHGWQVSAGDSNCVQLGAPVSRSVPPDSGASGRADCRWDSSSDSEPIYLEGAGVILLHPFLEALFRDRQLLSDGDFRDSASRARAVHLLGWMTYAREEVAEFDLLTAKVLCGFPLEEPLEPAQLDAADKAACDSLLQAVLNHWTALRSTSTDWLREGFFLREGKLEPVEQGWRLTVERHAQDILLARLPWGVGVIGLPWMTQRIFVRWLD